MFLLHIILYYTDIAQCFFLKNRNFNSQLHEIHNARFHPDE